MLDRMVIHHSDNSNEVTIKKDTYEKLQRLAELIGDRLETPTFYDFTYLLVRLRIYLEIRIPYVIEKNYNFFSEQENRLLKELHAEIEGIIDKYLCDTVPYDLSVANRIMLRFMSIYDTINDFFEMRLYINKRDVLLKELQVCLDEEEYSKYRDLLIGSGNDIKKLKRVVELCERIILDDWRKKLTDPNEFCQGEKFAFICHLGGEINNGLVSASLLTDKIFSTYSHRRVGFILDSSSMFHTSPQDCYLHNNSSERLLAMSSHVLTLLTKDTVESQTLEQGEDNYNEICLSEFKPIGLLVLLDDKSDNFFYEIGQELRKKYPTLPLVYINKSLYKQKHFN